MATKQTPASRQKKKKKGWLKKLILTFVALGVVGLLAGTGLFFFYAKDAPPLLASKLEDTQSSRMRDPEGNVFYEVGQKKRQPVKVSEVPDHLKEAITSIEDKRFYKHLGVDPIRIAGAALSNAKGNNLQGGSTLTQQLIKLSYYSTKSKDQNIKRKAQEAWLAMQLERRASKDLILNYYINKVYMANGYYGMGTAAKAYYGKSLKDLSIAQTALLAGMPQAPNSYNPYMYKEAAKSRRDLVLSEMKKDHRISQAEYDAAVKEPIDKDLLPLQDNSKETKIYDNYIKQVIAEVKKLTDKDIYSDGLEIYTNIEPDAQKELYDILNNDNRLLFPGDDFQTAVTVLDAHNGQVLAQIGGRKIADNIQLGTNRAVSASRDFGSTVKPITDYAPAIEYNNYSTGEMVYDGPYNYPDTSIAVNNYDNAYKGNMTIRDALIDSRNVPAIKTLEDVGLNKSKKFLKKLGIAYPEGMYYPNGISGNLTTLKMAAAYAPFANGGKYYKPQYVNKIVYPDGTEEVFSDPGREVMKASTAYMITDMLKDVITYGTGSKAQIGWLPQAGKTGTSNYAEDKKHKIKGDPDGAPDITFVGYTPNYVVAVWTGYDDYFHSISTWQQQYAMVIYQQLMSYLSQRPGVTVEDWEIPKSVVKIGRQLYHRDAVRKNKKSTYYYDYPSSSSSSWFAPSSEKESKNSSSDSSTKEESKEEENKESSDANTPESQPDVDTGDNQTESENNPPNKPEGEDGQKPDTGGNNQAGDNNGQGNNR